MPDANTAKIAALNDRARQRLDHCRWILTQGVLSCDPITVAELLIAVEDFDAFTPDNDPYAEHDFGVIKLSGDTFFWKFDYYDLDLQMHSPDPTDTDVTHPCAHHHAWQMSIELNLRISPNTNTANLPYKMSALFMAVSSNASQTRVSTYSVNTATLQTSVANTCLAKMQTLHFQTQCLPLY